MKKNIIKHKLFICALLLMFVSCQDLDLNPLSEAATGNWYSNDTELDISLNYLFQTRFWSSQYFPKTYEGIRTMPYWKGYADDDFIARGTLKFVNNGGMTGQTEIVTVTWELAYNVIASANAILENMDNVSEEEQNFYGANARFVRASMYSELIFRFGDVPYYTNSLTIDEAFALSRTPKEEVLEAIYDDYDFAIANLPEEYDSGDIVYATKGAALAMKARIALYMGDYETARDACKECMDLNIYSLHPDYETLFLSSTKTSNEYVFKTARSHELGEAYYVREPLTRLAGGYGNGGPSWDLLCAYLCTDGLPIDESPLFDPHNPFENRDPRCCATIVEFGTRFLNYTYDPHPDVTEVWDYSNGTFVSNQDSRGVQLYCSFNGLTLKKFVDDTWIDQFAENENIIVRYADVLLMYAEAKIELGDIDQSVLDAMNEVRARAYEVNTSTTSAYPAITSTSQTDLRKILRIERRMEFAWEGWRYNDLIRWRLAEEALTKPVYGLLDPAPLRTKIVNEGLWFFPSAPSIDENGLPDFEEMYNAGYCKLLAIRAFDATKNYLWPIPSTEIEINKNLVQNPNY